MIKVIASHHSQAVGYWCDKLGVQCAPYDVFLSQNKAHVLQFLQQSVGAQAIVLVGNVGDSSALFAEAFDMPMFYDKFAERNILEYCKLANMPMPPQHVMDKLCVAPESFNHFASAYGYQCACYGEVNKTHVYIVPDDLLESKVVYENYFVKDIFKQQLSATKLVFKVFGLHQKDVEQLLSKLPRTVSRTCETTNLDSKITLIFPPRCAKSVLNEVVARFNSLFNGHVYANCDQSLAKTVIDLLHSIGKTLATTESITGGLVASTLVEIAGASSVLKEGLVTYSIASKCARLGINPHFVDEYGVVSPQVAQEMATGLLKAGSDVALSTTGFAGPTTDGALPVGLCYIGIATEHGVSVFKNVFAGDRNAIRAQAANTALFLLYKTVAK